MFVLLDEEKETLSQNDGNGWSQLYERDRKTTLEPTGLNGFNGGPLVVFGNYSCGIEFVSGSTTTCSSASAGWDVSTVGTDVAYAVYNAQTLRYDSSKWTQWGSALGAWPDTALNAIWASSDTVLVAANGGKAFLYPGANSNQAQLQSGLPVADNLAAWGFGASDLWLGNSEGQLLHYDGSSWSVAWTGTGDCRAIRKLWGANQELFFITDSSIGVWSNGNVTILADYQCQGSITVQSLWGNSPSEVFFVVTDSSLASSTCGDARVFWFDGNELNPL